GNTGGDEPATSGARPATPAGTSRQPAALDRQHRRGRAGTKDRRVRRPSLALDGWDRPTAFALMSGLVHALAGQKPTQGGGPDPQAPSGLSPGEPASGHLIADLRPAGGEAGPGGDRRPANQDAAS